MGIDVTTELANLLDGTQITMSAQDICEDIHCEGKAFVCRGNLPQGCAIHGAKAIVVDGGLKGTHQALANLLGSEMVIVLGDIARAQIQTDKLIVTGSVENAFLTITNTIEIVGHISSTQVHLGLPIDRLNTLIFTPIGQSGSTSPQDVLYQQIEMERRSLGKLLKVTGVVFNLNIGKIVQQNEDGLKIDLTTFYEAVDGRTEKEVDHALQQFFAKAVMGLLTRLNRDYLASGRGHQERFKKVVHKLKELIFKKREFDKYVRNHKVGMGKMEMLGEKYDIEKPKMVVQGSLYPSFEVVIQGVKYDGEAGKLNILDCRFELEKGRRQGTDETRYFNGQTLLDMVIVPSQTLENVNIRVKGDRIKCESHL